MSLLLSAVWDTVRLTHVRRPGSLLSANASGTLGSQFKIEPTDQLFCVDSDGITCSQVMHVLLRRVCRRIDFTGPPAGTSMPYA